MRAGGGAQLGLDRVLLVPVHTPPHKEVAGDPGVEHRVELCRRAVAGDERLGVSRVEADVPGPSFTVDTLSRLHDERPEDELTFIVGGDMAPRCPAWREPEASSSSPSSAWPSARASRRDDIARAARGCRGAAERIRFFDMPRIDISSS